MSLLSTVVLLLFLYISVYFCKIDKDRKYGGISLIKTFLIYWIVIVFLGSFHYYGLYDISFEVYILVIEGCFAFLLGYIINGKSPLNNICTSHVTYIAKEYIVFRLPFFIFLGVAIFIILKQILLLLPIILVYGMSDARSEMQIDDSLVLDGSSIVLLGYFAKPFVKATMTIMIVNLFHNKVQLKYILLLFFLIGIYFFSEGGRAVIMDIFLIFCYLLYSNRHILSKRNIKIIRISIIIIGLLPVIATLERDSDIVASLYMYYCGSLQYMSQVLTKDADFFKEHLYGMASFQGLVKPFSGILNLFGVEKPQIIKDASDFILDMQYTVYDTAPNYRMNFFCTIFGYAYKDGGYIANFIILFIYGVICKFVDIKAYLKSNTVRWVAIKVTFFYCVMYSMTYMQFSMYNKAMTLIYIFIITSNFFSKRKQQIKLASV